MVPPLINPNAPDFAVIHSTVQKAIDDSEAIDNRTQGASASRHADSPRVPLAKPTPRATPSRSSQTDDLGKVCSGLRPF